MMTTHLGHDTQALEGRSETYVWLTANDPLFVRADLLVRKEGHLGAMVDGILLDLGPVSDQLSAAMDMTTSVHIRADHFNGGLLERRVPLVHQ